MNEELLARLEKATSEIKQYEQGVEPRYVTSDYKKMLAKCISAIISPDSKGITVYGDFDNDGIISAIMLQRYLRRIAIMFKGERGGESFVRTAFSQRKNSFGLTEREYLEFSKESSLVIAVDNGSSSTFLHEDIPNLIILDHHECEVHYPFIINPNAGRGDGLNYSTSGGKVVFDFILNLDNNMDKIIDEYSPDEEYMKVLQVLASFTLISDMAVMDKDNRKFTEDALRYLRDNYLKFPFTMRFDDKDFSSRSISFNVISQVNAMGRMEEDLSICENFIAPVSLNAYLNAEKTIDNINKKKKELVSRFYNKVKSSGVMDNGKKITFVNDIGLKTGLLGLFANKLSKAKRDGPVICMSPNELGTQISSSARGKNVLQIMEKLFEYEDIKGRFGGHPSACGASIKIDSNDKDTFLQISKHLEEIERDNPNLFEEMRLDGIVTKSVTLADYITIANDYGLQCAGIDLHKKLYLPVSGYQVKGSKRYDSGWCSVILSDIDSTSKREVKLWCEESTVEELGKENMSIIFELLPNKDHSIHSVIETHKVSNIMRITEEAKPKQPISVPISDFESLFKSKSISNPLFILPTDMSGNIVADIKIDSSIPMKGIPTMVDVALLGEESAYFNDEAEFLLNGVLPKNKELVNFAEENNSVTLVFPEEGFSNAINELDIRSPQIAELITQIKDNMLGKKKEEGDELVTKKVKSEVSLDEKKQKRVMTAPRDF